MVKSDSSAITGRRFFEEMPVIQILSSILLGFVLPVGIYAILPKLGITQLADFFSEDKIRLLFLISASTLYLYYLNFMVNRPTLLLYQALICSPLVVYFSRTMPGLVSETLIVIAYMVIPTICLVKNNFKLLYKHVPFFKYFTAHMIIVVLYFIFYQREVYDYTRPGQMGLLPIGYKYFYDQITMYLITILAGSAYLLVPNKKKFLSTVSRIVSFNLIYMSIIGMVTCLLGLKEFYMQDHLVRRAQSLLSHPNEFAEYLSISLFFLIAMFLFRLRSSEFKIGKGDTIFQISAAIIGFIALILTFSKTILLSTIISLTVFSLLMILAFRKQLVKYFYYFLIIPIIVLASIFGFQAITHQDLFSSLQDRVSQNESMEWRLRVNDFLTSDINPETIWFGYGLSAANEKMSTFETPWIDKVNHDNKIVQVVKVHNAFLKQIYDFGLLGIIIFIGLGLTFFKNIQTFFKYSLKYNICILDVMISAFILFYLIACSNETIFENGAYVPPFWLLITILYLASKSFRNDKDVIYNAPTN